MTRMNPEVKDEWLKALRSGDYVQGFATLHFNTDDTFCCLGVLCDLAVKHGVIEAPTRLGVDSAYGSTNPQTGVLPDEVMLWAGLDHPAPSVGGKGLTGLNDSRTEQGEHVHDFADIADRIEEHL